MQRVLLLGGTSEIGLAIVAALPLAPGATVILAGRDAARLADVALPVGVSREVVPFDVVDLAGQPALLDRIWAGGDVDVTVLATGVLGDQEKAQDDPALAAAVLRTNLVGPAAAALHVAARMRGQGHGALVVLSSVAGLRGRRANFIYGASKAGLDVLAEGLADLLAGSGATVLVVRPGFVHGRMTAGMTPAPLATTPAAVGKAVAAGLAAGRNTIYVPAALRPVMTVLRVLPRPLWRRMPR
ncbi:MAG TPA: SDR family NAD(P)-dependent oxidoreductase [Mycobacteriales bacterium]|nr:SDR family NAD(P)-dependent oxidoreductase [Mycobacteriales bacterium]